MPRTDPRASFEVAVRHLFRHLDEAEHLKNNPLVRRYFRDPSTGRFLRSNEQAGLRTVHRLVREAAEQIREADLKSGEYERAFRRYTIAMENLLQRRSMAETARALGIGYRQCYRERIDLCRRIARAIVDFDDAAETSIKPVLDAFEFQMRHAKIQAAIGDVDGAFREYELLFQTVASPQRKIEVLCETAQLFAWGGARQSAMSAIAAARVILSDIMDKNDVGAEVERAWIALALATVSTVSGDILEARVTLGQGIAELQSSDLTRRDLVRELYVRILSTHCEVLMHCGDFVGALASISRADAMLQQILVPPPLLGLSVALLLHRLRGIVLDCGVWRPARERGSGLANAFELASVTASPMLMLDATAYLMEYHRFVSDDDTALEYARHLLAIMRQFPSLASTFNAFFVPAHIANELLHTKYWRYVPSVLHSIEETALASSFFKPSLNYLTAFYCLRSGDFQRALDLACSVNCSESSFLAAKSETIAAASADALGKRRQAGDLIESAVSSFRRFGSMPALSFAYGLASEITGNSRFERDAEEIAHTMGAERPFALAAHLLSRRL